MPMPVLAQFSPEVSIGGYAFVTVFYLVLMLGAMWLFKATRARLILLGLLTAIASVGYSGIVGPSVVVAPTMMKIAFLLVLGGVVVPLVVRGGQAGRECTTEEEASHD
jgi:hypothetical protein